MAALLLLYGGGLVARLGYLQVHQHATLAAESDRQAMEILDVRSRRGLILDRNHTPLAVNLEVESVYADPQRVDDPAGAALVLGAALGLDHRQVERKLTAARRFVWIKRKAGLEAVADLKFQSLAGIGFIRESLRFYPQRELAASTLGFVGMDNKGLEGIEHQYDDILHGATRRRQVERDALGRALLDPIKGWAGISASQDLELTLDEVIQFAAERALAAQVRRFDARGGIVLVLEPVTGDVLALATEPPFNPNRYAAFPPEAWRNRAVSYAYEPGSIFKPIVAAASLEENTATPEELFFCENGLFKVGGTAIREAAGHKFGWLSLARILTHSSNIGAIKVAQKLGENRFYNYLRKFGFGGRLGVDLPGESAGKLRPLKKWSGLSLASISFGHEISVTPMQMAAAIAAIANGGTLMKPRLARAVWKNGTRIKTFPPQRIRRVISEKTSRRMVGILKSVVREGTGRQAALAGFEVAGKTGTAQKVDPATGRYSSTAYLSSFVGFVPADAPRLVILVMIDEPRKPYWGGKVAAPVFREIARKALRHLNVPSNRERVFVLNRA
ncbi:MAG: peptidoglycan D,D-transpeptidase FtsI family protein [Nitrospinaceae bacterium]